MAHSKIIETNNPMAIRVQNVSFAYDGLAVLQDVSLQVPAGSSPSFWEKTEAENPPC